MLLAGLHNVAQADFFNHGNASIRTDDAIHYTGKTAANQPALRGNFIRCGLQFWQRGSIIEGEVNEMADRNSAIGVFDSGVGGVGTLAQLMQELPDEHFIYYGDTAHAPYGTKTPDEVMQCVRDVMAHLQARDVKAVVIACNTATSVAAATLREELTLPIIGMEPALKPASENRQSGDILVLATPVTLSLQKFERLMEKYGEAAIPVPCPGLMELVEARDFAGAEAYLAQVFAKADLARVDAVVLGCTHYVFLRPILSRLLPQHVTVYDGNLGTARQLHRVLESRGMRCDPEQKGSVDIETSSDDKEQVLQVMHALLAMAREQLNA